MSDGMDRREKETVPDRAMDLISVLIFLTMVFRYSHKPSEFGYLFEAAAVAVGIALLFIAWAYYNKTSVPIEQYEHDVCDTRGQR